MPTLSLSPSFFRQNRVFHWIPLDKIRKGSEKWNSSAPREVHVPRRCPRMSAWISLNDNNDLGGTRSDLKKKNSKRSITADAAKGGQVEGNFSAFTAAVSRRNSPCDWREKERQGELDGWFQIRDKKLLLKVFDSRYKFRIRSSQWTRARHTFTRAQTSERRDDEILWRQKFRSLRKSLETFIRSWRRRCVSFTRIEQWNSIFLDPLHFLHLHFPDGNAD